MSQPWIRHGYSTIRPYLYATNQDLIDMVDVLGARIVEQHSFAGNNFHTALQIGDGICVAESSDLPLPEAPRATTIVYVEDLDSVITALLSRGWALQERLSASTYGEKQATLVDHHGNLWYLATFHGH